MKCACSVGRRDSRMFTKERKVCHVVRTNAPRVCFTPEASVYMFGATCNLCFTVKSALTRVPSVCSDMYVAVGTLCSVVFMLVADALFHAQHICSL